MDSRGTRDRGRDRNQRTTLYILTVPSDFGQEEVADIGLRPTQMILRVESVQDISEV